MNAASKSGAKFSVLILTYNEEANLPGCLNTVAMSDDIVVLDSESTDRTPEIAEEAGATILQRPFDNYAAQRNHGLAHDFKHDWVLMIDADERLSAELAEEIANIVTQPDPPITLYRCRRQDIFMGRWIKRSSGYPTWFGRLFRKGRVRTEREINEEYVTDGEVGLLQGHLVHYPFNKGLHYWFERHNRYSTMEASKLQEERNVPVVWTNFWNRDPMLRRKAFKAFAYRMPLRPLFTFGFLYLVKGGVLDGRAGLHFSIMRAVYEYLIDVKIREIRLTRSEKQL